MPVAVFQCAGSRTRLVGGFTWISTHQIVWYATSPASLFGCLFGTRLIGRLSKQKNGQDVFALDDGRTRFVGRLITK